MARRHPLIYIKVRTPRERIVTRGLFFWVADRQEAAMNGNVGYTDRIVRIVAGVLVLSLFFVLEGDARWVGLAGIVLIGTALVRW